MKVPIQISYLSENGFLQKALVVIGLTTPKTKLQYSKTGITFGPTFKEGIDYDDYLTFTVAQLLELPFEPGTFEYCPHCKKLLVECKLEQLAIAQHNEKGAV